MNSANRQQLLSEYADYNRKPMQMKINNQTVIIPVEYTFSGSTEEIHKRFLFDYFDEQKKEYRRYKKAGVSPRLIKFSRGTFVVPYRLRNSERKDTDVIDLIFRRAKAKYNRAVSLTRKMSRAYPERKYTVEVASEHVDNLRAGYNRYLIEKGLDMAKAAAAKAAEMILEGGRLVKGELSSFQAGTLKKAARKTAVSLLIGSAVALGTYGVSQLSKKLGKDGETKDKLWQPGVQPDEDIPVLTAENLKYQPKEIADFSRSNIEKDRLFNKYMKEIFESEGGYADKTIDQPTNMGIIQPTLNVYRERFSEDAKRMKFPKTVKHLKKNQAEEIYRQLYFNQYGIGNYRNESIGMLVFDLYVNHEPKTVKKFIDQALKAAKKQGAKVKLPSNTGERVAVINSLATQPRAEAVFYAQILKERRFHMYQNTVAKAEKEGKKSRFANGLMNRANKYNERYISTGRQEQSMEFCLAMKNERQI